MLESMSLLTKNDSTLLDLAIDEMYQEDSSYFELKIDRKESIQLSKIEVYEEIETEYGIKKPPYNEWL